jgi:hypothetical protein
MCVLFTAHLAFKLTKSMQQSPSCETNSLSQAHRSPSCQIPSGFLTKILSFLIILVHVTYLIHLIILDLITLIMPVDEERKL